jgi:hypothetical protein
MKKPLAGLSLAILLIALDASTALALNKVWGGTGPGPDNWSAGANWVGGVAPIAGDDLTFPDPTVGPLSTNTNNDFQSNISFNSLTLNGAYSVTGNGFQLDGVNPTVALTVGPAQKAVISTGAIFMHQISANATTDISVGAGSTLDMSATPQVTVGGSPPNVTNLVLTIGTAGQFLGPASLTVDTFHLTGSGKFVPKLLTQNANTPGTILTDPGTQIATSLNAGAALSSSSSMTINGDLLEAVSAQSTGGLDFQGPVTFGNTANVSWEAFNSNVDNVINFTHSVDLSPAKFHIQLPAGFKPYAPNAVYPVITSQGPAFTPATELFDMKEGQTQTVGGYIFTARYNVPDPGDLRVEVSGPPPSVPSPPATGAMPPSPSLPAPAGALLGLAFLLLVTGTATFRWRRP